ncbi:hypothetical protein BCV69DRAFT_39932 [Microstroma glucosiphilum]|uniref:Uncharacterized protein n=1 Tax=Pseudomicrostroma glucosiphilum TaxID=1684307 RepID=A0A316U4P6_9BASI|nr:hypothetical protein BCV69DRAFT_39932 [Pseudomicrostroma glucosiphilum]PWN19441.1 hypothetical protein BCV69DRAFT_39932 [Pseudomicrostroma glucosiphilum]
MALCSLHLSMKVDPEALLPGEPHIISVSRYFESRHVNNPARGEPPPGGTWIKLARFPFESMPTGDPHTDNLPIEPKFLGLWLGDGTHDQVRIASSDFDETREYLAGYVHRLNATRPRGAAPLHLRITPHIMAEGAIPANVTCFEFAIASTFRDQEGFYWNPLLDGLHALGIFANRKARRIPARYLSASEGRRSRRG